MAKLPASTAVVRKYRLGMITFFKEEKNFTLSLLSKTGRTDNKTITAAVINYRGDNSLGFYSPIFLFFFAPFSLVDDGRKWNFQFDRTTNVLLSVPNRRRAKMSKVYKEDEISIRVDRCLYDSVIKFGKSRVFFFDYSL